MFKYSEATQRLQYNFSNVEPEGPEERLAQPRKAAGLSLLPTHSLTYS